MFESFIGVNFWTAFFILLNTLAIFFVAKKYLIVPVHNMIESRQKEIDDMYENAGAAKDEALKMKNEYMEKLSEAQQTGERLVKEAVQRGQKREEEILRNANNEAAAIRKKAAEDIELEKKKAINDAKDEISEMAIEIAGKVVEKELSASDHAELIDRFIDGLGDNK